MQILLNYVTKIKPSSFFFRQWLKTKVMNGLPNTTSRKPLHKSCEINVKALHKINLNVFYEPCVKLPHTVITSKQCINMSYKIFMCMYTKGHLTSLLLNLGYAL